MTPTENELLTALQTRIELTRAEVSLLQLQAKLVDDPAEAERCTRKADRANSDLLMCLLVAQCLRTAIQLNHETKAMLTGWPVVVRPKFTVVSGA